MVCDCVCVHVQFCVCTFVCAYKCIYVCAWFLCVCVHASVCMCAWICFCVSVYMYFVCVGVLHVNMCASVHDFVLHTCMCSFM